MTVEQEIELEACKLLKDAVDDYHAAIWAKIKDDVIDDVKGAADAENFTTGDVALAIGRAVILHMK